MPTVQTNIRLPKEVKEQLQAIAESEHRTLSNLISKILIGWLKGRKPPSKTK